MSEGNEAAEHAQRAASEAREAAADGLRSAAQHVDPKDIRRAAEVAKGALALSVAAGAGAVAYLAFNRALKGRTS